MSSSRPSARWISTATTTCTWPSGCSPSPTKLAQRIRDEPQGVILAMPCRVAAIPGGAGHIGRAIAQKLADRGVLIAVLDKSVAAGQALMSELQAPQPTDHRFIKTD